MKTSISPWIRQLNHERPVRRLGSDLSADVVIIGAGIAGISTAFFALKKTHRSVVMLEKYKLAHGATGHNAGQVVTYFERAFRDIVADFGLDQAIEGQRAVESAWDLLELMYQEAGLDIPFSRFSGHAGFSSKSQVLNELEDNYLKAKGGIYIEPVYISENVDWLKEIPKKFKGLYQKEKHQVILDRLQTDNTSYLAVHSAAKGCINSALFCEGVLKYLERKYPERFALYEHATVNKIVLRRDHALIDATEHTVRAKNVVLCTNGFENLTILNDHGLDIDTEFHHLVEGKVGYMSGYLEAYDKPPAAISYYSDVVSTIKDPYFYLTRRMYEHEDKKQLNLICVGGPDISLEDRKEYIHNYEFPEEAQGEIDAFLKNTYDTDPGHKIDYQFTWHGLMGYTPNGIRLIGSEPKNPTLLYNLGCNGVGILPSIYGGLRLSSILSGKKTEKSIFDPVDHKKAN